MRPSPVLAAFVLCNRLPRGAASRTQMTKTPALPTVRGLALPLSDMFTQSRDVVSRLSASVECVLVRLWSGVASESVGISTHTSVCMCLCCFRFRGRRFVCYVNRF